MAIEEILEIDINSVKVKKRVRGKDVSIDALIESIKRYGLLQPIVVDEKMRLIAGFRRLEACKSLGYSSILARVVKASNDEDLLLLELEENECRVQFSQEELSNAKKRIEKLRHPNFFVWLYRKIKAFFTGR